MYIPTYYKNENINEVMDFIRTHSFGILINLVDGKPWATHIPLELYKEEDGNQFLEGHIAKANPQSKTLQNAKEVLCIFNGPHAYISSSWYKEEEVPTWNYVAVHIYGKLTITNEEETMASLERLVTKYEQDSKNPIVLEKLSAKTLRQVKGVTGFRIGITEVQAAYKLSQTRIEDHKNIQNELLNRNDENSTAIATAISKNTNFKHDS